MDRIYYVAHDEWDARPLTPYRAASEDAKADLMALLGAHPNARICTLLLWEAKA